MSGISTGSGLFSGIDTASLIDQLMKIEARPKVRFQQRVTGLQLQQSAILDINARTLEVRREPHGKTYRSTHLYDDTQSASPLAKPGAPISVAALLPK